MVIEFCCTTNLVVTCQIFIIGLLLYVVFNKEKYFYFVKMAFASAGPIKWSELNVAYGFNSNATFSYSNVRASTEGASFSNISLSNIQNRAIPYAGFISRRKFGESATIFADNASGNTIFNNTKGLITYVSNTSLPSEESYCCEWNGFITLSENGTHWFYLNSDDGSELYINNAFAAAWYGLHGGGVGPSNSISLNAGVYPMRIRFQEWGGGEVCEVNYKAPSASVFSALNVSTQTLYAFKPYIKLDANDLAFRQGQAANSAIATWSNMGTDGTAVHATGASGNSSGNPTLTSDANGYMVTFDRTKQQHLTFNSSLVFDKFRSSDNADVNGLSFLFCLRMSPSSIGSGERIFEAWTGAANTISDNILISRDGTTSMLTVVILNGGNATSLGKILSYSQIDGDFHVYGITIANGSTTTMNLFIDGNQVTDGINNRGSFTQGNISSNRTLVGYVGRSYGSGDAYFLGDIRELQVYREVIPASTMIRMSKYLMMKWGVRNDTPFIFNGLVGYFTGESWTGSVWNDISPIGNNSSLVTGSPVNNSVTLNGFRCMSGGTAAGIRFPAGMLVSGYTLFHVARYNGSSQARIFDDYQGGSINWLSGFWSGQAGVAYHNTWITGTGGVHGSNWVLSVDQKDLYKSNGTQRSSTTGNTTNVSLSVNYGSYDEKSDWACACIIAYNRTLSAAEISQMELYLNRKYAIY